MKRQRKHKPFCAMGKGAINRKAVIINILMAVKEGLLTLAENPSREIETVKNNLYPFRSTPKRGTVG
jgi:hypothetical protein